MTLRPSIPATVRREILIEASYRCAVPRCRSPLAIDVHHIDGNPANNVASNLIPLYPTCHRAYHRKPHTLNAIQFCKLMLHKLNPANDTNTTNLLLMLPQL